MNLMRLLLPAFFLLVLGLGNIAVGSFKEEQYREVYEELIATNPSRIDSSNSALGRIRNANNTDDIQLRRRQEATERRNLYLLVAFGGKILVTLSLGLLFVSCIFKIKRTREKEISIRNTTLEQPTTV